MAKRRRDRWALGAAYSLPEAARCGLDYDVSPPDPVLAWVQFPDRILEVEARVIAYTERAVLAEWGFGQATECAWLWRDAVRAREGLARHRPALQDGLMTEREQIPTIVTSRDDHTQTLVHLRVPGEGQERRVWIHGPVPSTLVFEGRTYTHVGGVETSGQGLTPHFGVLDD